MWRGCKTTKIWDTGANKGGLPDLVLSDGNNRVICWCEANAIYATLYLREAGGNTLLCYAHGNSNSFTEEILVRSNLATGRLGLQATIVSASLDVHQTGGANDHVHIILVTSTGELYHAELVVPNAPQINGNWSTWIAIRYQRVDNTGAVKNAHVSVDGNGDPHVVWNDDDQTVHYNLGNGGAPHTVAPGLTQLIANPGQATHPTCVAIVEETRDIHAFWENGVSIDWRWCDNLANPLVIGNWTAAAAVLTFPGVTAAQAPSVCYWWDGGPLTQMMVVANNDVGDIESNWYDEGNVNGWGGGWRASTTEVVLGVVRITQVSGNDFALTHILAGICTMFGYTDYAGADYDFQASTFKKCTNSVPTEIGTEFRGREHDDYSFGMLHVQAGDIVFDLVRVNTKPGTSGYDPDNGTREDETAIIVLDWDFDDPGQSQRKYRVQVDLWTGDYSTPEYDSGVVVSANSQHNVPADTFLFNTHYKYRVKVWDSEAGTEECPYSEGSWEE